jgi:hypothetical protein
MKVNDFVRTKDGIIDKVIIDYNGKCASPTCNCKHISCEKDYYDEDKIIKSSPNIIDLIEVGDYVNGKQVEWVGYDLYKEHDNGELEGIGEKRVLFNSFTKDSVRKSGIKSIVTKEQFESIKYRIKE